MGGGDPTLPRRRGGAFAEDPPPLLGLAAAELGAGEPAAARTTLERLRAAHPALHSPRGHLLYTRALEDEGRPEDAADECAALTAYFVGPEARVRHGLLLQRLGRAAEARSAFGAAVAAAEASRVPPTPEDRDWRLTARRNLEA